MSAGVVVEAPSCSMLDQVSPEDIDQSVPGFATLNAGDILLTTQFQRDSLRKTCMHFSLSIPGAVDLANLNQALQQLVADTESI
ncbi:uncharacterized protein BDV14DRAFT_168256, partial [Aspergillus stella-maris]|uniref:uncharacterized protein n=1 Tax=Aspergillus stella-maris TaxID=1810926 RepID=UPI003CCC97A6